ncbi:uncharacterized protein LOC130973457 isoform X3 [Arachis stenosperma]|uniref:uncharacterized protein LOC130973457 isoform X3 n=1 Tax=Arachis stenosperma TaxID=217475 RepID=UPI0025AC8721|nr:uncharacterized protein LOC130973457 isoform X3 [Arachis stenosperma]
MDPKPKDPDYYVPGLIINGLYDKDIQIPDPSYYVPELMKGATSGLYDKDIQIPDRYHLKSPPSSHTREPTEAENQFELKLTHPYHVLAMDHYNKSIDNKEEEYEILSLVSMGKTRIVCFGYLGFLHHLFWKAVPKNSPSTAEPRIFYARVHEFEEIHIPFCGFYSDSIDDSESCEICGLKNYDEFRKKAKELQDKEEEKAMAINNGGYLFCPINFSAMYQSSHGDKQMDENAQERRIDRLSVDTETLKVEIGEVDDCVGRICVELNSVQEQLRKLEENMKKQTKMQMMFFLCCVILIVAVLCGKVY